jgi:hypothetical protein
LASLLTAKDHWKLKEVEEALLVLVVEPKVLDAAFTVNRAQFWLVAVFVILGMVSL